MTPIVRLTRREREVLVELCRPILERASFHEPAPTRDIARALFVTETAVKQHLLRMYEKLDVPPSGNRCRALANAALDEGILSAVDLGKSDDNTNAAADKNSADNGKRNGVVVGGALD